jgi:DNA-binding MarR family transcriptional regulator
MSGGRRRAEDFGERHPFYPWVPPAAASGEIETLAALGSYRLAMRFRRLLNRQLRPLGVSFAEWRVLEATSRLFCQTGDPVSHQDVARELDSGENSVSRLMWQLSLRGLLSHDIDGLNWCFRVRMTDESEPLVARAYEIGRSVAARVAAGRDGDLFEGRERKGRAGTSSPDFGEGRSRAAIEE